MKVSQHVLGIVALMGALQASAQSTLQARFATPAGTTRVQVAPASFAAYLRELPLLPAGSKVLLHNGGPKGRQDAHAAVVALSVGTKDLQQCADAVIRLRAEHLFAQGMHEAIAFNFTNGFRASWERWRKGERIRVAGNNCTWVGGGARDSSHDQFLRYLETVFMYAGTLSLARELKAAADKPIEAGDVFIQGGSPGHAVLVLDVAQGADGSTWCMLGQSYMPAQQFHVLRNTGHPEGGPWYKVGTQGELRTPEWTFSWSDRRRW